MYGTFKGSRFILSERFDYMFDQYVYFWKRTDDGKTGKTYASKKNAVSAFEFSGGIVNEHNDFPSLYLYE